MDRSLVSRRYRTIPALVSLLLGLAGCGAPGAEIDDPVSETHSELLSDPSGTITVDVTTGSAHLPNMPLMGAAQGVQPPPVGFVLIGGGGGVLGEPEPGALMQETLPQTTLPNIGWRITVTPHVHASPYQFSTTAISLKLTGVNPQALRGMVKITSATGLAGHQSTAIALAPAGNVVLGGGAAAPTAGNGQLLVASMPHLTDSGVIDGWTAVSKDHEVPQVASATSYVISIPRCPPGFAGGCLQSQYILRSSSTGFGYRPLTLAGPGVIGGVLTGVGAETVYSDAGRLLTRMLPAEDTATPNQFTVDADSKDHSFSDSGWTAAWAIVLSTTPH